MENQYDLKKELLLSLGMIGPFIHTGKVICRFCGQQQHVWNDNKTDYETMKIYSTHSDLCVYSNFLKNTEPKSAQVSNA